MGFYGEVIVTDEVARKKIDEIVSDEGGKAGKRSGTNEIFNDYIHNKVTGDYNHAEGKITQAEGINYSAHAEGGYTLAKSNGSHAEGIYSKAWGRYAHAEGQGGIAVGIASHAEGIGSQAIGNFTHAEGCASIALGTGSHAEGYGEISKIIAKITIPANELKEDTVTIALNNAKDENGNTITVEGIINKLGSKYCIWEMNSTNRYQYGEIDIDNKVLKCGYQITNENTSANIGNFFALYPFTHNVDPSREYTIEIYKPGLALGINSHSEGKATWAQGDYSHSEGIESIAKGYCAHSQGRETKAQGNYSHAGGQNSQALGNISFAHGEGIIINNPHATAFGKYNNLDQTNKVFQIGWGDNEETRKDLMYLDKTGYIHATDIITQNDLSINSICTGAKTAFLKKQLSGKTLRIEDNALNSFNPIVSVHGKNLLDISSWYKEYDNGSFVKYNPDTGGLIIKKVKEDHISSSHFLTSFIIFPGTYYYFPDKLNTVVNSPYFMLSIKSLVNALEPNKRYYASPTKINITEISQISLQLYAPSNIEYNENEIHPYLIRGESGTADDFRPALNNSNVRLYSYGKNLFNIGNTNSIIINQTGQTIFDTNTLKTIIKPNTTYTISYTYKCTAIADTSKNPELQNNGGLGFLLYDKNNKTIIHIGYIELNRWLNLNESHQATATFTTDINLFDEENEFNLLAYSQQGKNNDGTYTYNTIEFSRIQLELGEKATEYNNFYNFQQLSPQMNNIDNLINIYPCMTLTTDNSEAEIDIEYNKDINKAFEEISNAIISLGGNI